MGFVRHPLRDPNNDAPISYDADGAEIYHGTATVRYEDREIVWESFRDRITSLVEDERGALTLARALDLEILCYE